MTKVLVLGNSHSTALKFANEAYSRTYPEVKLSYFGAPGWLFKQGQVKKDGHFHAKSATEKDREIVQAINGANSIDVRGFDRLFVVGHRPSLLALSSLADSYGRLEGSRAELDAEFLISEALIHAWVDEIINTWLTGVASRFRGLTNVTFTDAPYRSSSILELADKRQEPARFKQFLTLPFLDYLMPEYDRLIRQRLHDHGFSFLTQPTQTLDGFYATQAKYCKSPVGADGKSVPIDHRHMNADFGFEMLQAYAVEILGLPLRKQKTMTRAKADT